MSASWFESNPGALIYQPLHVNIIFVRTVAIIWLQRLIALGKLLKVENTGDEFP